MPREDARICVCAHIRTRARICAGGRSFANIHAQTRAPAPMRKHARACACACACAYSRTRVGRHIRGPCPPSPPANLAQLAGVRRLKVEPERLDRLCARQLFDDRLHAPLHLTRARKTKAREKKAGNHQLALCALG
eukprot:6197835-Pleurochrysis_carterae.AAC.6